MNDKDIQHILLNMTNFYNEYLPTDPALFKVWKAISKIFEVLYREYRSIERNSFISDTETLRTIPYFKIDISQGLYGVKYAESISTLPLDEQVATLKQTGWYVPLNFSGETIRTPVVHSMKLQQSFDSFKPLDVYKDYFIYGNKIYLLPKFVLRKRSGSEFLHAFEIKVDDQRLERNWGTLFNLETGPYLPRYEYRAILEMFDKAFASELTIKNIKESIRSIPAWSQFEMWDRNSRTLPETKRKLYDRWVLSPAHFIIALPEKAAMDRVRMAVLMYILGELKPPETQFMMFYDVTRIDGATHTDSVFPYYPPVLYRLTNQDNGVNPVIYDYYPDTSGGSVESQDFFEVHLQSFPEIPRNFKAAATATFGEVNLSWRSNTDGTETFELYGAANSDDPYTLLTTVNNDTQLSEISVIHDKIASGKRNFKLRSIAGSEQSMWTLPIDTSGI